MQWSCSCLSLPWDHVLSVSPALRIVMCQLKVLNKFLINEQMNEQVIILLRPSVTSMYSNLHPLEDCYFARLRGQGFFFNLSQIQATLNRMVFPPYEQAPGTNPWTGREGDWTQSIHTVPWDHQRLTYTLGIPRGRWKGYRSSTWTNVGWWV